MYGGGFKTGRHSFEDESGRGSSSFVTEELVAEVDNAVREDCHRPPRMKSMSVSQRPHDPSFMRLSRKYSIAEKFRTTFWISSVGMF